MKIPCLLLALFVSVGCAGSSKPVSKTAPVEMLVNGNFADGDANWTLEQNSTATGKIDFVNEGPDGKAALRLKVLSVSGTAWHVQLFQKGLRFEKDKNYLLTFWAKSDRAGDINVN